MTVTLFAPASTHPYVVDCGKAFASLNRTRTASSSRSNRIVKTTCFHTYRPRTENRILQPALASVYTHNLEALTAKISQTYRRAREHDVSIRKRIRARANKRTVIVSTIRVNRAHEMRRDILLVFTRSGINRHAIRTGAIGTAVPRRRSGVPRVLLLRQRPPRVGCFVTENRRGRAGDEAKRGDAECGCFRRAVVSRVHRVHRKGNVNRKCASKSEVWECLVMTLALMRTRTNDGCNHNTTEGKR